MKNLAQLLPIQQTIKMEVLFEENKQNNESSINLADKGYYGFDERTSNYYPIKELNIPVSGIMTWKDDNGTIHTTDCNQMAMKPGRADKVLFIRCTEEEHTFFSKTATMAGLSLNQWVLKRLKNIM